MQQRSKMDVLFSLEPLRISLSRECTSVTGLSSSPSSTAFRSSMRHALLGESGLNAFLNVTSSSRSA